jgi:hypothetical protein
MKTKQAAGWLLAWGCVCASAATAHAQLPQAGVPERIDGVAAYVGGKTPGDGVTTILRSDVELRARLALLGSGASDPTRTQLPPELLQATLDELVSESLVALEALRLGLTPPSAAELKTQRDALALGDAEGLRRLISVLGVLPVELDAIARRRAVVGSFLAANLEGTVAPSDADVVRAYESGEHPFRDEPLDQARNRLAAWLTQQRLREAVARWVRSLRERTPHRVLWEF